ncbi:hypothetical protein ACHHYP_13935 [Achlya hypogyna]|uniref:Uncharacterized protein n=1 Tax=Achlya hypogyna TaxID=1202772 RepID=A0A1V9YEA2_ACHHY|nr:hypothetical protein ACHHYP_13935 [Achlya hypogyna]
MEVRNQRLCLDRANTLAFDCSFAKAGTLWNELGIPASIIDNLHPDLRAVVHALATHTAEIEQRCKNHTDDRLSHRTTDLLAVVSANHAEHAAFVADIRVQLEAQTAQCNALDSRLRTQTTSVTPQELESAVEKQATMIEQQHRALRNELQCWTTELFEPLQTSQIQMPMVETKLRSMLDHERIAITQATEFQMEHWSMRMQASTEAAVAQVENDISKCSAEVRSLRQLMKAHEGQLLAQCGQHVKEHSRAIFDWKDAMDGDLRSLSSTVEAILSQKLPAVAHEIRFEGDRLMQFASKTFLSTADFESAMKRVQELKLEAKSNKLALETQASKWTATFDRVSDDFKLLTKKIALIPDVVQDFHDRFEWNDKQCSHRWEQKVADVYALEVELRGIKTSLAASKARTDAQAAAFKATLHKELDAQAQAFDLAKGRLHAQIEDTDRGWRIALAQLQYKHANSTTTLDCSEAPATAVPDASDRLHVLYTKLTADVVGLAQRFDGFLRGTLIR